MDSFFFNITDRRYKVTPLLKGRYGHLRRVDISNGIVFFESKLSEQKEEIELKNLDRMVMIVMVNGGVLQIDDHIDKNRINIKTSEVGVFCSSR